MEKYQQKSQAELEQLTKKKNFLQQKEAYQKETLKNYENEDSKIEAVISQAQNKGSERLKKKIVKKNSITYFKREH